MRIGILGGTFNPIHNAHLRLAELARERLKLDKVIFMPAYIPPHKKTPDIVSPEIRYEMVKIAIAGKPEFELSDMEIKRKGESYSIDTLKALGLKHGEDSEIFFITGSDSLSELNAWKNIDEVLKLCRFVVANRPSFPMGDVPQGVLTMKIPDMAISSSDIRKKIKKGEDVNKFVPNGIIRYIKEKGLYKS